MKRGQLANDAGLADLFRPPADRSNLGRVDPILVEVLEPANPAALLSEWVKIQALIVVPREITSVRDIQVQVLLRGVQNSADRGQTVLPSRMLSRTVVHDDAFVESLEIRSTDSSHFGDDNLPGKPYLVTAILNASVLVPEGPNEGANFVVSLAVTIRNVKVYSKGIVLEIPSRDRWGEARGGINFPCTGVISSNFLAVEGWAARKGDQISSAEILINGVRVGYARLGIPSPSVSLTLPDIQNANNSIFVLTLRRDEIARSVVTPEQFGMPMKIEALVHFESGRQLKLRTLDLLWNEGREPEAPAGELERVSLSERGRLVLEGWMYFTHTPEPRLFLQGCHRSEELLDSPEDANSVQWTRRPEIEYRFFKNACAFKYGFRAEINPLLLGRFPGVTQLWGWADGKLVKLSNHPDGLKILKIVSAFSSKQRIKDRLLNIGTRTLTNLGIRDQSWRRRLKHALPKESKNRRLRILVAAHNLSEVEGAPKVLWSVLERLARNKASVSSQSAPEVLVLAGAGGGLSDKIEKLGFEVHVCREFRVIHHSWHGYTDAVELMMRAALEFKPDLIYSNTLDCMWAEEVASRLSIPSVWVIHEGTPPENYFECHDQRVRLRFLELLDDPGDPDKHQLVFVSPQTRDAFQPFTRYRLSHVVPNGVDIQSFDRLRAQLDREDVRQKLGIKSDEIVISVIGTTAERKGQDVFLREMAILKGLYPKRRFKFFVVGCRKGEFLDSLKDQSGRSGLREVIFVPETPDVVPYYLASDYVAVTSRHESAPLVVLEAFALSVPVVSTFVAGLKDQIKPEENALCFDSADVGSLAQQLQRLIDSPELSARLTAAARTDCEGRFNLESGLDRHQDIIRNLIS